MTGKRLWVCLASLLWMAAPTQALADLSDFKDVKVFDQKVPALGLTLTLPYEFEPQAPALPGQMANFHDGNLLPAVSVATPPRNEALPFEMSAKAATQGYGPTVKVLGAGSVDLGGVTAEEVLFDFTLPVGKGVDLRVLLLSVYLGDKWVLLTATTGQKGSGFPDDLRQALYSARFEKGGE